MLALMIHSKTFNMSQIQITAIHCVKETHEVNEVMMSIQQYNYEMFYSTICILTINITKTVQCTIANRSS